MTHRAQEFPARSLVCLLLAACVAASTGAPRAADKRKDTLDFAADMAKRGNWREALFRWRTVTDDHVEDPRVLNNIAVAHEALGEPVIARGFYDRAVELSRGDERIEANQIRFVRFWSRIAKLSSDPEKSVDNLATETNAAEGAPKGKGKGKGKGKAVKVTVHLPVPPRLDTTGYRTVLIARFLAEESAALDVPHEMVRFLRSKIRKDRDLELLDVVPAPEVPEQTLEDLIDNAEFWKYLGREYGADLIVSGTVEYDRRDHSGFQDVDRIDPTTGQKIRQSEFVEQEKFGCVLEIIFMGGSSGELVYRDRLQRSAVYRGSNNDPITAFHDMSESLTADLMAIVEPRTRADIRFIFKK